MAELPDDTQLIYANWARVQGTLYDLSIDLGYTEEPFTGPPDSFPVRVVMSWEHAKGLAELLENNLKVYEEHAGAIRNFADEEEDSGDDD